jgi:type II secretory pathway component PulC
MPLENRDIFSGLGESKTDTKPTRTRAKRIEPESLQMHESVQEQENPSAAEAKPKPQKAVAEPLVPVSYKIPASVREALQALSFATRTPQNEIVSKAIRSHIKRQKVELPSRVA